MTSMLNADSYSPLYRQLIRKIRSDIAGGVYPVNSRIPSEQELCDTYNVSRVTVRKALQELSQEGILRRHQGKGTFVSTPRTCQNLNHINSFSESCRTQGLMPATRVLHCQLVSPDKDDLETLLVKPEDTMVETYRLRLADGMPVTLETNRYPMTFEWLMNADLSGSLYELFRNHEIEPFQATHSLSMVKASEAEARILEIPAGTPLMNLYEVVYDSHGSPLYSSRQLIRGEKFVFKV